MLFDEAWLGTSVSEEVLAEGDGIIRRWVRSQANRAIIERLRGNGEVIAERGTSAAEGVRRAREAPMRAIEGSAMRAKTGVVRDGGAAVRWGGASLLITEVSLREGAEAARP